MSFDLIRQHLVDQRKVRGRTQADVARSMGTTQSAVSDLEAGRTKDPGINTLARWSAAVDVALSVQLTEALTTTIPIPPRPGGNEVAA